MDGFFGKVHFISEWIMRFSFTNILWLLFNLPIVYFVLKIIYAETFAELQMLIVTVAILAPFILFPATAAMFGVVRNWIIGKQDLPVLRSFWKYYRENYVRGLLGGLVIVPIWSAWVFNYFYSAVQIGSFLFYFFIVVTMFLFTFTVHFFSDTVHFQLKFKESLIKSVLLTIGNPHYTIGIAILNGMFFYIGFKMPQVFLPFLIGSVFAYLSFFGYYRTIMKAQSMMIKLEQKENEAV